MPTTVTFDQAMQLADQDCPLPSLAGPALKALRARVLELEAATLRQAARVDVTDAMVERAYKASHAIAGESRPWLSRAITRAALEAALSAQPAERQGEDSLYVEARQCEDCDHLGMNDCSDTHSACGDCEWQGPTPDEDKCPGCGHENCMAVACPECGGRYRFLADRRLTHAAAPVGVPDGMADWVARAIPLLKAAASWMPTRKCAMHIREIDRLIAAAPSAPQGVER